MLNHPGILHIVEHTGLEPVERCSDLASRSYEFQHANAVSRDAQQCKDIVLIFKEQQLIS
jgi:hypothetical protein